MIEKLKHTILAVCLTLGMTGCSDFLDILPMNEVVLENYWTEKGDVMSVVNSCYETLEHSDCLTRMGVWGELRSDNLRMGANVPDEINEILKENLLPSNPMCNWGKFYEAINRCNTVCHYAPGVQEIDPNYTMEEMKANIAEVSTIRALCYFYLIRTFRNVPYSTAPSIDDSQEYVLPASSFDAVLDSLIENLELVKNDAVRRYYTDESPNAYQNSSKITRWAIYALLADLYRMAMDSQRRNEQGVEPLMGIIRQMEQATTVEQLFQIQLQLVPENFYVFLAAYFAADEKNATRYILKVKRGLTSCSVILMKAVRY